MPNWTIEKLADRHDRGTFSCGKTSLDEFLQKYATQYQRRDLARTYVAVLPPDAKVLGYYTLSSGAVDLGALPDDARKKLPRHPVPVGLLGRLAVDLTARGQRLGETLLLDALGERQD
jgi:predicted GNAT family N-acyltransferase